MQKYGVIYLIRNNINNKIYIGQTSQKGGFDRRYKHDLENYTHNKHLKSSIKKHGIDNFYIDKEFDVAYSQDELNKLEDMYIKIYNSTNPKYGYNKQTGGNNGSPSIETRSKLRQRALGRKYSEEARKKMGEARIGKPHLSEAGKEVLRKRMSGANNPTARKVICITTCEVFETTKDGANKYNTHSTSIIKSCKSFGYYQSGKLEDGTKLHWMYYEDYLEQQKEAS